MEHPLLTPITRGHRSTLKNAIRDFHLEVAALPERLKAGEAVIDLLRLEGVTHIFGIVGSSFLDILDPLYDRDDMQFIGVRHEQGGALMADGFSRISGTPSV